MRIEEIFRDRSRQLLNLRERTFKIEIRLSDLEHWRHRLKPLLILLAAAALIAVWLGGFLPSAKANLATFYPTSCLGGWENPQNAAGQPNLSKEPEANQFDYTNSAVLSPGVMAQLFCGGFRGEIPRDAEPKHFILRFSWVSRSLPEINVGAGQSGGPDASVGVNGQGVAAPVAEDVSEETRPPDGGEIQPPVESAAESMAEPPAEPMPPEPPPSPEPPSAAPDSVSWWRNLVRRVFADDATTTAISDKAGDPFLEVLYTLDSVEWFSLGTVAPDALAEASPDGTVGASFAVPLNQWNDIEKLQISIRNLPTPTDQPIIYLDGLFLEVEYERTEEIKNLPRLPLESTKLFRPSRFVFRADESPTFEMSPSMDLLDELQEETSAPVTATSSESEIQNPPPEIHRIELPFGTSTPESDNIAEPLSWRLWQELISRIPTASAQIFDLRIIKAELTDGAGQTLEVTPRLTKEEGKVKINLDRPLGSLRPGKYRLRVEVLVADQVLLAEQEFLWGVLAINVNKSIYQPGDEAYLQMAVLNDSGHTICDGNLRLEIGGEEVPVTRSDTCGANNVTDEPDYFAYYKTDGAGRYEMKLTNLDNGYEIEDSFSAIGGVPFDVERVSATRINPFQADYTMRIKVTAREDFTGEVIEIVPNSFEVQSEKFKTQNNSEKEKTLIAEISLGAGETQELSYTYRAPQESPRLYLLGPLRIKPTNLGVELPSGSSTPKSEPGIFQESRRWQIAADNACQSADTGTWSDAVTWTGCGDTTPQATDTVTILNTHTVTLDADATILTIDIQSGGTLIHDSSAHTLTLSGTTGTLFTLGATGTFTPSTYISVVMNPDAAVTLTSGTFTGVNAFYNLTLSPTITVARIYTFGSGALTITGDFTINPSAASALELTVNMGANIAVYLATLITRTTSATSVLDTTASNRALSTGLLNIATGGTLTANGSTITLWGNLSPLFTRVGTFNADASTVVMNSGISIDLLTSGTITFYNLTLSPAITIARTYTFGADALTINGDFTINPTAASAVALTVNMGANITVAATKTTLITRTSSATSNLSTTASNYALSTGKLNIATGGTLTANGSTITLTGTSGTLFTRVGTFTQGTSNVVFNGDGSPTLTSNNTIAFYTLNISPTITDNRTYTFGSGALTIGNTFTINPSAATALALTVNMGANITLNIASKTTLITRTGSATSVLNTTASNYALSTGLLNIATGGTLTANGSTITLRANSGTLFTRVGTFTQGTSNVTFTTGSIVTLLSAATTFHKLTRTSGASTITAGAAITISDVNAGNGLDIQSGTLADGGSQITGTANGTLSISSGAALTLGSASIATTFPTNFTAGNTTLNAASTVIYQANAAQSISSTPTYGNLTLSPTITVARTYTFGSGALTINGDFTVNPTAATALALTVNMGADITVAATKTTLITRTTSATSNLSTNTTNALSTGLLNIATGGTLTAGSATITLTGTSGTLFTCVGTFTANTSTVVFNPDAAVTLTSGDFTGTNAFNKLQLTPTITTARTYTFGGAASTTDNFDINPSSTGANALTVNLGGGLTVASTATTTITKTSSATANLSTNDSANYINTGGLDIESGGTFTASSSVAIAKDYVNNGTATLTNSTVTLNGSATQTLSGTMTGTSAFYALTITNSSGTAPSDCEITGWVAGVDFAASASTTNNFIITTASVKVEYNSGSLYTFQNINWNGQAAGTPIYFRNSAASGTWKLYVPGTQTAVSYVNVSRSDASGSTAIDADDGTNTDCGNNTNWTFGISTYLYFSVDSATQTFPTLTPGTLVATTSILTVRTNNASGFYLTLIRDDSTGTMKSGTVYITDKTDWSGPLATTTPGNATASTTEPLTLQFRIRLTGTDEPNYASAWWGSDDTTANALFAGIPAVANKIIIRSTAATATTTSYALYNVNVPSTQQSGNYSGAITYTATANP